MLRDQYEPDKMFLDIALRVGEMEPDLVQIDWLLEDDELYQMLRADLAQRYPHTSVTGRPATPVTVVLRMLAVKHLYNLSYEQTERQVRDSLILRQFCRVYFYDVPDDTTLLRWANQIQPQTLMAFNQRLAQLAYQVRVTLGRKLRTDGTVVESNIGYPCDSKLLADGVRVIGRTLKRLKTSLGDDTGHTGLASKLFCDHSRSARHQARHIQRWARQRSQQAKDSMQSAYRRLVDIAQASVTQAHCVVEHFQGNMPIHVQPLLEQLCGLLPNCEQAINQTVRRVFVGVSVPAQAKLVSLFEPHSAIIRRQKPGKETEFGHKVWLDEVDGGIVTRWAILAGNPPDETQWQPAIDHHLRLFGRPPNQASADRGLYSAANEAYATQQGVKRVILPKPGHKTQSRRQFEAQAWFKRGRRYHAGIEGRISVLKRKFGLHRARYHGQVGFARWVGWGVIAHNLTAIGAKLAS
jgi:transposase, IS5 family